MAQRAWCGLNPTSVRASSAAVLLAQNKELPPHYAANRIPVSFAIARAIKTTGLLLYFGGQQNIPFRISESANVVGALMLQ